MTCVAVGVFGDARVPGVMTRVAELRLLVVHDEELAELIVVRFVAGRALKLAVVVEFDLPRETARGFELRVARHQRRVVAEADRMVVRKVRAQVRRARRKRRDSADHRDSLLTR